MFELAVARILAVNTWGPRTQVYELAVSRILYFLSQKYKQLGSADLETRGGSITWGGVNHLDPS